MDENRVLLLVIALVAVGGLYVNGTFEANETMTGMVSYADELYDYETEMEEELEGENSLTGAVSYADALYDYETEMEEKAEEDEGENAITGNFAKKTFRKAKKSIKKKAKKKSKTKKSSCKTVKSVGKNFKKCCTKKSMKKKSRKELCQKAMKSKVGKKIKGKLKGKRKSSSKRSVSGAGEFEGTRAELTTLLFQGGNGKKALDSKCTANSQCVSKFCDIKKGKEGKCGLKYNGKSCTADASCITMFCDGGKCALAKGSQQEAPRAVACQSKLEYKSGYCVKPGDIPKGVQGTGPEGSACKKGPECQRSLMCGPYGTCVKPYSGGEGNKCRTNKKGGTLDCKKWLTCKNSKCTMTKKDKGKKCLSKANRECKKGICRRYISRKTGKFYGSYKCVDTLLSDNRPCDRNNQCKSGKCKRAKHRDEVGKCEGKKYPDPEYKKGVRCEYDGNKAILLMDNKVGTRAIGKTEKLYTKGHIKMQWYQKNSKDIFKTIELDGMKPGIWRGRSTITEFHMDSSHMYKVKIYDKLDNGKHALDLVRKRHNEVGFPVPGSGPSKSWTCQACENRPGKNYCFKGGLVSVHHEAKKAVIPKGDVKGSWACSTSDKASKIVVLADSKKLIFQGAEKPYARGIFNRGYMYGMGRALNWDVHWTQPQESTHYMFDYGVYQEKKTLKEIRRAVTTRRTGFMEKGSKVTSYKDFSCGPCKDKADCLSK